MAFELLSSIHTCVHFGKAIFVYTLRALSTIRGPRAPRDAMPAHSRACLAFRSAAAAFAALLGPALLLMRSHPGASSKAKVQRHLSAMVAESWRWATRACLPQKSGPVQPNLVRRRRVQLRTSAWRALGPPPSRGAFRLPGPETAVFGC